MSSRETTPQPSRQSSHQSPPSSYFSYPVSIAVSGILRRLSNEPTKSLSGSRRSSPSSSQTSLAKGMNGAYFSPPRTASPAPFQPPPLTPLSLEGWRSSTNERSRLLTRALAEEIRLLFPPRNQLVDRWRLIYSLDQDGSSLSTLYKRADDYRGKRGGFVLVVRDSSNDVFAHRGISVSVIDILTEPGVRRLPFRPSPPSTTLLRYGRVLPLAIIDPPLHADTGVAATATE